jgi:hypothetical protein
MPKASTVTKPVVKRSPKPVAKKARPTQNKTARPKAAHASKPVAAEPTGPRRLAAPKRVWTRPATWRQRQWMSEYRPLPKGRVLLKRTFQLLWANKKVFGGLAIIYALLNIALVRGLASSSNLTDVKSTFDLVLHGFSGKLVTSLAGFVTLLGDSGTGASATSGVYQYILLTICGLAVIWTLRQAGAKQVVRVRDGFYRGMHPLVPFVLVQLTIGLQLMPIVVGSALYTMLIGGGILIHFWERVPMYALFALLAWWSLRMLSGSIFAMFIVALPDMTPLRALRRARHLVHGRRLQVWRKLIFLPVALLVLAAAIEIPLITFLTPLAPWAFFGISVLVLPVAYGYLYTLYREML